MPAANGKIAQHDVEGIAGHARQEPRAPACRLHHVQVEVVAHAGHKLIKPRHIEVRWQWIRHDQHDRSGNEKVDAVDLALRGAPTDCRPLHRPVGTGAVVLGHAEAGASPPEGAEDLPELYVTWVYRLARYALIAAEQVGISAKSAHRQIAAPEPPGVRANPAEVAHGIADMGDLPVEDGDDTLVRYHHVAVAKVVVHQGRRDRRR